MKGRQLIVTHLESEKLPDSKEVKFDKVSISCQGQSKFDEVLKKEFEFDSKKLDQLGINVTVQGGNIQIEGYTKVVQELKKEIPNFITENYKPVEFNYQIEKQWANNLY